MGSTCVYGLIYPRRTQIANMYTRSEAIPEGGLGWASEPVWFDPYSLSIDAGFSKILSIVDAKSLERSL